MKASFFLDRPNAEVSKIYVRIGYGKQHLRYYLSKSIPSKYWNQEDQQARQTSKFPQHPEFNQYLKNTKAAIDKVFLAYQSENNNQDPSPEILKGLLDAKLKPGASKKQRPLTFLEYFQDFIDRSDAGTRIRKGKDARATTYNTNKGYGTTISHLKAFAKQWRRKLDFNTVDLDFYNDYTAYLTNEKKLSLNTIGDHFKRIKAVMHEATAKGINTNMAFTSPYFTRVSEESDSIYLNEDELEAIEELDLSGNKRLDAVRDLFLIGCYTGQRFSDWGSISAQQVKSGIITIQQVKTQTQVSIPVHPKVKAIFEKYNGKLPKPLSNQLTNERLKEVAAMVDVLKKELVTITTTKAGKKVSVNYRKCDLVTTHTARRSFATNEYKAGTPSITIMAVTGHKTERAFLKYIRFTQDQHAQHMLTLWNERQAARNRKKMTAV